MKTWKKIMFTTAFIVFMLAGGITNAFAEFKRGVILEKRGGDVSRTFFIDTSGLEIYDTVIRIREVSFNRVAMLLDKLMKEGVIIEFDNRDGTRFEGGVVRDLNHSCIISIDGRNVAEIFSSMLSSKEIENLFPYANR